MVNSIQNDSIIGKTLDELANVDFGSSYPIMEESDSGLVCVGSVDAKWPQEFNGGKWHIIDDRYAVADIERSEAYHTGYEAGSQGEPLTACPYPTESYDADEWLAGWNDA